MKNCACVLINRADFAEVDISGKGHPVVKTSSVLVLVICPNHWLHCEICSAKQIAGMMPLRMLFLKCLSGVWPPEKSEKLWKATG